MLFSKAIDEYLQYTKLKKKKNTYLTIERRLKKHIVPFFKTFYIEDIKASDYLKWQIEIDSQDFKFNYKSALHYTFIDFFNFCELFYGIQNVPKKVGNFKNNDIIEESGSIWTLDEFNKFISVIDDEYYKILFELLFFTGMRKGELLALTWNDIDFYNKTLQINKTITRTHEIQTPKTKSSNRIITIDDYIIKKLNLLKKLTFKGNNNDLLFNKTTFSTLLRKKNHYCDKAGVKQIKIHEFRHSHACLLFDNNVPINQISHRLGHSKISITTDTYLKYLPINEKNVILTLNSLH